MISFLPCFNIITASKAAYLISGSILIILNDGVFEMDLNNTVLTGKKLRGAEKMARIPIKVVPTETTPKKPEWIRTKISQPEEVQIIKDLLRQQKLHTVCEEAACPNLPQCFSGGTATFMIMGDICTRRCPFCDVAHGRPNILDPNEPKHLAETVKNLNLKYVVITSVDRDDLKDGGAQHFADCIREIRQTSPETLIEILVPDFRGRADIALKILSKTHPMFLIIILKPFHVCIKPCDQALTISTHWIYSKNLNTTVLKFQRNVV